MSATDPASQWLQADWPAPANVRTLITTRQGGHSLQPFNSFNRAAMSGMMPTPWPPTANCLRSRLPDEPAGSIRHGHPVVNAAETGDTLQDADASYSTTPGKVCVVMTADCRRYCCDDAGSGGGKRGWLARPVRWCAGSQRDGHRVAASLMAWLARPSAGCLQVGAEVRAAFMAQDPAAEHAFYRHWRRKHLADIYLRWHASWRHWVSTGCMAATSYRHRPRTLLLLSPRQDYRRMAWPGSGCSERLSHCHTTQPFRRLPFSCNTAGKHAKNDETSSIFHAKGVAPPQQAPDTISCGKAAAAPRCLSLLGLLPAPKAACPKKRHPCLIWRGFHNFSAPSRLVPQRTDH
jgi:copper oxidase (laccase) domain-containing protein